MTDILRITAHHEAAHAVVLYRTAGHAGGHMSIVARPDSGGLGHAADGGSDSSNMDHLEAVVISCYAGACAQRQIDAGHGDDGCDRDNEMAGDVLHLAGWEHREREFRERADILVRRHWLEIVAVAEELLRVHALDMTEIELIADAAAGDPDASLAQYRANFGPSLEKWRAGFLSGGGDGK